MEERQTFASPLINMNEIRNAYLTLRNIQSPRVKASHPVSINSRNRKDLQNVPQILMVHRIQYLLELNIGLK